MQPFEAGATPEVRRQLLEDNADKKTQETYTRKLTPEELTANRERVTECLLDIDNEADILKEAKDRYKEAVKPIAEELKMLKTSLKTKHMEVSGILYHFADQEAGTMTTYDELGNWVGERRLRPDEKQTTINNVLRMVANG